MSNEPRKLQCLRTYTPIYSNIKLQGTSKSQILDQVDEKHMGKCMCEIGCGKNCLNRQTNVECSAFNCKAVGCVNRRIQRGHHQGLEVFDTGSSRGMGLRCRHKIEKATFIIQYIGEVFDRDTREGEQRWRSNHQAMLFYMMRMYKEVYIDASRYGNLSRFINHSCEPNSIVQVWQVDGKYKLAVFANKDLEPLEEITYNYGKSFWISTQCICQSSKCVSNRPAKGVLAKTRSGAPISSKKPSLVLSAVITFPQRYIPILKQHLSSNNYPLLTIELAAVAVEKLICYKYEKSPQFEIVVTGKNKQDIMIFFDKIKKLRDEIEHLVLTIDMDQLSRMIRELDYQYYQLQKEFMYQVGQVQDMDQLELFLIGKRSRILQVLEKIKGL